MTSATDERLARLLGGAELSDLRARLRRRYEFGPADGKLPSIQVGKLKRSLELANKMGARFCVILGENEISSGNYGLKNMASGDQETVIAFFVASW